MLTRFTILTGTWLRYGVQTRTCNDLEKADVRLWSRVYCKGNRFNIKQATLLNLLIPHRSEQEDFHYALLEFIRQKLGKWYWKRRQDALSLTTEHSGVLNTCLLFEKR
uniref:Uncharacterized protein n=1 Tax=Brassica oleracea TaxID=3712 RepID=A0A3P6EJ02_BRAOL|nr:unnamed protein product [Brassica oleracea]